MRFSRYMSIALVLFIMVLAACGDDDDDNGDASGDITATTETSQTQDTPVATPQPEEPGDDPTATEEAGAPPATQTAETVIEETPASTPESQQSPESTPATGESPSMTATTSTGGSGDDNVYPVGDAGEVEMRRDGDNLELIEVRPADGWTHEVDDEDDDEIEIEFRDNGREIDFEAEIDDGRLKIDICDEVINPTGDVYTVGEAGEVEARQVADDDDSLELIEVRANDGWSHEIDTDDDDEIEVEFRRDNERMKFDLEIDDGRLEAKTCSRTVE